MVTLLLIQDFLEGGWGDIHILSKLSFFQLLIPGSSICQKTHPQFFLKLVSFSSDLILSALSLSTLCGRIILLPCFPEPFNTHESIYLKLPLLIKGFNKEQDTCLSKHFSVLDLRNSYIFQWPRRKQKNEAKKTDHIFFSHFLVDHV